MTPTLKLRFVERDSYSRNGEHFREPHKVRVLQQYWAPKDAEKTQFHSKGEWRDVLIEKEQA